MNTLTPPPSRRSILDIFPPVVKADAKLSQLIGLMSEVWQGKVASCVLVIDGTELIGIVTEWDIVQLAARGVCTDKLMVTDIVVQPKITLLESELGDPLMTLSILHQHKIHHLPVINSAGICVGLVTPNSIQQVLQPSNLLKVHRVGDAMNTQVVHVDLHASALRIAQLMTEYEVDCVVLVDNEIEQGLIPVGTVTAQDIVCLQHQGASLATVLAQTVMRELPLCLTSADSLWLAYEEMQQRQVEHLVVTDQDGKILGMLTQLELLRSIDPTEMHKSMRSLRQAICELEAEKVGLLQNRNAELEHLFRTRTAQLEEQAKCDRLLASITLRLHESLNVEEILFTTVVEVQQFLQIDRAIIYRLTPEGSGVVVAESVNPGWTPMLGEKIHNTRFATEYLEAHSNGQMQVADEIYQAGLAQCHINLPDQFQVRANLVLPIICHQKLWGLLVTQHCTQPRYWRDWETRLLGQLVKQVGIALKQSELYEQAQMELKERQRVEEELSQVFKLSLDLVCVAGMDGYFKRVNPSFTRILGYSEQELLNIPFLDLVHPDDRQATLAVVKELSEGRPVACLENRYRCKDGSYRWLSWTAAPDDPIQRLIYAIARDVTDQKHIEIQLKQSRDDLEAKVEERTASWRQVNEQLLVEIVERNRVEQNLSQAKDQLQAVLDAVPGLVSWMSHDLRYLGVNRRVAATFNRSVESFSGQPLGFLAGRTQFMDFFQQFFAQPIQTDSQEIMVEVDGSTRSYLIVAQKYDQNQAAVSVGIDISDRKQAEIALKESEAKFRSLVEQTNDWVWAMDCNWRFTYLNPRVRQLIGYDPEEILNRRIFNLMPADEAIRSATVLGYFMHAHEAFSQIETTILHKKGHPVILEMSGSPVLTAQGELQGYRGITRDITERKQVERDIRIALTKEKELGELKTRFISMASHEFRTPLTTILASAESLERYHAKWTDDKKRSALQRIQTAVQYMTNLLNDVLIFGKGEAGKLEFNPGLLNLEQCCAGLVEEFQFKEANPERLLFNSLGDSSEGWVDEKLLRHILVNLLANALKYSPPDTLVRLDLACQDGTATFKIQDAGIGIPDNEQKRLFDSFYRATNVGNIPGTGLGLAIVMRAVKAHGGAIAFTSDPGAGTTFTVSLPITEVKSEL
ncbi:MAG: PAS domain S-box protein [Oscillatoriophycideae cyanobacterium NC_groundwater_1537_Pr4_S-0.65um_50_18]|nr:PAS domain S-box protein [Oscillatoriophycideae cyanobacterium NC_groundwater_1537_Pr4_S-0.65um_50_18]